MWLGRFFAPTRVAAGGRAVARDAGYKYDATDGCILFVSRPVRDVPAASLLCSFFDAEVTCALAQAA